MVKQTRYGQTSSARRLRSPASALSGAFILFFLSSYSSSSEVSGRKRQNDSLGSQREKSCVIDSMGTYDGCGDGSYHAPNASIQHPALLDGYAVRPPWMVAGVDYAVGFMSTSALRDWHDLKETGMSIVGNLVRIDNISGAHLNLVDFS